MKLRKKTITAVLIALIIAVSLPFSASAYSPEIRDIDITARLDNEGNAYITEVWDVTVASGTEWYLVQGNLGDIKISDFMVSDENGRQFINEGDWDTQRSIEEKEGKCGIVDKGDEYELCWGVGSLGNHKYTVSYKMTNVVKRFSDADGFNNRFINEGLSDDPQHIKVTISRDGIAFNDDNSDIWAFGFEGNINFTDDGKIVAESSSSGSFGIDYVNIMVGFTSGIFNPTSIKTDETFGQMKETAFEGSDYDSDTNGNNSYYDGESSDSFGNSMFWVMALIFVVTFFLPKVLKKSGKNSLYSSTTGYGIDKNQIKSATYCRDIPFGGSITASYNVLKNLDMTKTEGAIISAYLLRWLQHGKISIKETPKKSFLGLLGDSMQPSIVFDAGIESFQGVEASLYRLLLKASGGDNILQEKEFFKWSKENYEDVECWLETAESIGADELSSMCSTMVAEKKVFFNLIKTNQTVLTDKGKKQALDMIGFKKYLEDFTIINERQAAEVQLWDDYLVFASLFGIADKVSEEFKKLCPDYFTVPQDGTNVDMFDIYIMMRMINTISYAGMSGASAGHSAAEVAQASAGGGGFSSFGGGGGFSGGGFGGGSR
ncbi:MAG: DUF2207 domain-containing protein [Oscillospiraceae bacterium]